MRKRVWKKVLSFLLAAMMVLSMAACGKGEGKQNENNLLAKQNVYSYENIDYGDFGDNVSIQGMSYSDGRVHVLLDIYIYESQGATPRLGAAVAIPEVGEEAVVDAEASESEKVDADFGVDEEYVYQESTNIHRVVSFLPDGSDVQYYDLDMGEENTTNSWLGSIILGGGNVYAQRESNFEDYSDPENPIWENWQEVVCWGPDGAQLWSVNVSDILRNEETNEYYYISSMTVAEDGSLYVICTGDSTKILIFDQTGTQTDEKSIPANSNQYINNTFVKSDGSLLLIAYNNEWTKMYASTYDMKTGVQGEQVELLGSLPMYNIYQGTNTDFLLTDSQGVYTYNIGDTEITKLMDFVNSDLETSYLRNIAIIDDRQFVATYSDLVNWEPHVAVFTRVEPEDVPDKEVLVLGAYYLDSEVLKHVIDFNKTNTNYRITVKDYSSYNTMDDYMAGYTQLNNDIIAGKMPDILMANNNVPVANYIAKGLLADVGKLIENDEELSQETFLQNVFDAYSVNGVLYRVVPTFSVNTIIGKTSVLGERTGWNMEEFMQLMSEQPEGTSSFGDITRSSFFYQIMQYCGTDFVDLSTGKCKFDSQEFINMLEFAKTLPEEIEYGEDYDWTQYESQYRNNKTLLMSLYIYSIRDLNYSIYGQFGEDVSFVGFPSENKDGSVVNTSMSFTLSAASANLDGAWEFVRYYLTDEYQDNIQWQLPVNKEAFEKIAQEATQKPYYLDENGNKVEYEETVYLNGESVPLPPMSQEQVDRIVEFVESVDKVSYYNEDIQNIIDEEAASFFADHKTAADVASIIQKRVELYVSENQ